jgi:neutral ceramidase
VIYGCHPDCVSGTQYSADYPAHLADGLRESLGADWRVVFLNACSGNINHIDVSNPAQRSGPEESKRLGRLLAAASLEALKKGDPIVADRLEARKTEVKCRLRRPAPEEVAEAEERLRTGRDPMSFNGLFAPAAVVLAKTKDREHTAEIAAMRLGSFALATMPGEIFVELGREVEAASPFKPTRTIGLTNGSMGYIPTREGYKQGGYEAGYRSARYEPENGHNWAAAAAKMLRRMGGE